VADIDRVLQSMMLMKETIDRQSLIIMGEDFLMLVRCLCGTEPIWGGDDDGPMGQDHIISNWQCPNCKAWIEIHTGLETEETEESDDDE
jgi:hypothetical protein